MRRSGNLSRGRLRRADCPGRAFVLRARLWLRTRAEITRKHLLYWRFLEVFHVSNRALRPDPGEQSTRRRSPAICDQESHDRQAPQADRAGGEEEGADLVPTGAFLRTVLLRRAEHPLV